MQKVLIQFRYPTTSSCVSELMVMVKETFSVQQSHTFKDRFTVRPNCEIFTFRRNKLLPMASFEIFADIKFPRRPILKNFANVDFRSWPVLKILKFI